ILSGPILSEMRPASPAPAPRAGRLAMAPAGAKGHGSLGTGDLSLRPRSASRFVLLALAAASGPQAESAPYRLFTHPLPGDRRMQARRNSMQPLALSLIPRPLVLPVVVPVVLPVVLPGARRPLTLGRRTPHDPRCLLL